MRLLKLQKSGFVDFERLRKEPFGDNWRITFHLVHWGHIVIGVRPCVQLRVYSPVGGNKLLTTAFEASLESVAVTLQAKRRQQDNRDSY